MSTATLMARHEVLVFDLDGTLIDSAGDISSTLSLALQDCGLAPLPPGERSPDLFSPLEGIVQTVLQTREETAVTTAAVVSAYRMRQQQSTYAASTPYPGVLELLGKCRQRGQRMAVCTNKLHSEALRMLEHFSLMGFFSHVIGGGSTANAKPSPDPLLLALEQLGAHPAEALMFGDTHVDALCAHQSKVQFVWHQSGYGGEEVLQHPVAGRFQSFFELDA
ncbi:MAG: HAD hydrolase-like protein [Polaromonas sp.]|uniref:HAD family hydrolase n=1 Tax=Polaromonas sp. TaxID=1869339 RepID=UPI002489A087|nr:HAD hydrolase-like protein [Polaromonas sp.]MDI1269144.1 HAD hydrolase-like protein [Polaromonas sp.]